MEARKCRVGARHRPAAIRSYRNKIGPWLQSRYGWHAKYTPLQVRTCALSTGVNLDYLCYAYAMYCARADFNAHHAATGETCDGHACNYDAMLTEIRAGAPRSDSGEAGPIQATTPQMADGTGPTVAMAETRVSGSPGSHLGYRIQAGVRAARERGGDKNCRRIRESSGWLAPPLMPSALGRHEISRSNSRFSTPGIAQNSAEVPCLLSVVTQAVPIGG